MPFASIRWSSASDRRARARRTWPWPWPSRPEQGRGVQDHTDQAAVEAGESLGYLPGDVMAKVDPGPLYDALYEMVDPAKFQAHLERGIIEIAPLAYMMGTP